MNEHINMEEDKSKEEYKKIINQVFYLVNSIVPKTESLANYISVYFRNIDQDHKEQLKIMMLENITLIKNNLGEIEDKLK